MGGSFYLIQFMETLLTNMAEQPFVPLNREEERILEMYSRGESYEVIQENLLVEYGMDYSNKKLGKKMGQIKSKMRCETQFQMGYLYGRRERDFEYKIRESNMKDDLLIKHREGYEKGFEEGIKETKNYILAKDYHKGLNLGLVSASIFWMIIMAIIHNYFL